MKEIFSPFYHLTNWSKRHLHCQYNMTVRQLLEVAEVNIDTLDPKCKERLNRHVSHICTVGYRFYKNCICVQYFDDTEKEMDQAMQMGAILLITNRQFRDYPCVIVDNPLKVYARMCHYYRSLSDIPATAIVGSIGKTTTKDMIRSVYGTTYKIFAEPTNDNLTCAVGFYSQHYSKRDQIIVQEVSEDKPGGIEIASEILTPHIAVITAIDQSHIMEYGSVESITNDICSICKYMTASDFVIINKDNLSKDLFKTYNCKVVTVSTSDNDADFYAKDLSVTNQGMSFTIAIKGKGCHRITLNNIYAEHNVICALYAFSAGTLSGVKPDRIVEGLQLFKTHGIRQNIFRVNNNVIVYADCYNAVAKSVSSAIEACTRIPMEKGKRIAVLGDVEEAGVFSEQTHEEIIDRVNNSSFENVFLFGPKLQKAFESYSTRHQITKDMSCYTDITEMNDRLKNEIAENDLVLFKSSRKSRLERCIKALWPWSYFIQTSHGKRSHMLWRFKMMIK